MKQKILKLLKESDGYVSGQEICGLFGVSRTAVWKAVNSLRAQGYVIDSSTNKGYRLFGVKDIVNSSDIKRYLKTAYIGKSIYVLDTVDSTNNFAKNLGHNGAESGIAVIARGQTEGKGRLGRTWSSKKDAGLWMSVLLRPDISAEEIYCITPLAGLAVYRVINRICPDRTFIKWPNDIIVGNKKICGILTELTAEADKVEFLVTGVGINVDLDSFPEEICGKATSLYLETGRRCEKSRLAAEILNELEAVFSENEFMLRDSALSEYKAACASINREIGFWRRGEYIRAEAFDINRRGALLAEDKNGVSYELSSGEVTVSGIY